MKKTLLIVFSFFVVVIGSLLFYFFVLDRGITYENILPEGPLVVLRTSQTKESLAAFTDTPIWKSVVNINWDEALEKNNVTKEQIQQMELIVQTLQSRDFQSFVSKFFGQEVVLAIYPTNLTFNRLIDVRTNFTPALTLELLENVYLVTKITSEARVMELYARHLNNLGGAVKKEVAPYGDFDIHILTAPLFDVQMTMVRIKDYLIIGTKESKIREVIDYYSNKEKVLSRDTKYLKAKESFLEEASIDAYFDLDLFFNYLREQSVKVIDELAAMKVYFDDPDMYQMQLDMAQAEINKVTDEMTGVNTIAVSTTFGRDSKTKMSLQYRLEEMTEKLAKVYSCPSTSNRSLNFIPASAMYYQWNNCLDYDFKEVLQKTGSMNDAEALEIDQVKAVLDVFEQAFGINLLDDVVPHLGDEIGGYLSGITIEGIFGGNVPIPNLVVFFSVKDKNKILEQLDKLKKVPLFMSSDEDYKGHNIVLLKTQLSQNVIPSISFVDNYMLITNNPELIRNAVDTLRKEIPDLSSTKGFQQVNFGLIGKNRVVQYLQLQSLNDEIRELLEWVNKKLKKDELVQSASVSGKKMRLDDIRQSMEKKEDSIKRMKKELQDLEAEIGRKQESQEDAELEQVRYMRIEEEILEIGVLLEEDHLREREAMVDLEKFNLEDMPADVNRYYLDRIVYPIMDGFKFMESYGARTNNSNGVIDTWMYLHTE
ncbi:MAG: DUF3352 domain-containing protein [Candidatus Omnitrophica bacterium]|nr:DUF3352 domain-containing protein [Candidatus Omnitrophota bacterium]